MNTETLTCAIIGHLVGDFILQNDYLATNKKKDSLICLLHCFIWTCCVCLFSGWPLWVRYEFNQCHDHFHWFYTMSSPFAILLATHFLQDRWQIIPWWMRLLGQRKFMECDKFVIERSPMNLGEPRAYTIIPGLGPWSVIVVDNIWHIVTIWAVWKFVA